MEVAGVPNCDVGLAGGWDGTCEPTYASPLYVTVTV